MVASINPRYKGLEVRKGKEIERTELELGHGDASEWGFRNECMLNYLSEIAKDPRYTVYSYRYKPALVEAISYFEKKHRKTNFLPEHIVVSGGGSASCFFSLHNVLLTPGDEVLTIVPSHYYLAPLIAVPYYQAIAIGSPAIEEDGWRPDVEDMRDRVSSKTKVIAITSPNNPTGRVYSEKELKAIVDLAGEFDIPIISDEVEGIITFDGVESVSISRVAGDVPCVTTSSLSKAFGCPGWSLGYMCFHDPEGKIAEIEKTVRALASSYGHPGDRPPTPIVVAATKAFKEGFFIPDLATRIEEQREFAWKRLNEIEGTSCVKSMGTYWQFPRVEAIGKTWKTNEDFMSELWEDERLAFFSGTRWGKGGFGHFRTINLPPIDVLEDAYDRLERFLTRHT